jgi:hypothetical protein
VTLECRVSMTLSYMSDTCLLLSFSSNSTFIMLHMYHEMDVGYVVGQWGTYIKSGLITLACFE